MVNKMKKELNVFVDQFDDFSSWDGKKQVDYFTYFLINKQKNKAVTATQIVSCYENLDLRQYSRIAAYLSGESKVGTGKYLKLPKGYTLERKTADEIDRQVKNEPKKIQVSQELADLVSLVQDSQEKSFLIEAINCFRIEAYRATIVMVWTLAIDHLQKYTFGSCLIAFNTALANHPDKTMKQIVNYDDFSELKEVRLIELMRSSGIISKDVRKILDEKLGTRNSAGHPSGIVFSGHKTTEFSLDLIQNVLLKY